MSREDEYYGDYYNETDYTLFEDLYPLNAGMASFSKRYRDIHGPLCVLIGIFGITANIFNVIVRTRKHMASPTNTILLTLGFADILALFSYVFFVLYAYVFPPGEYYTEHADREWIDYAIIWPHISFTFEIYGMWLTVTLSAFQFASVCLSGVGNRLYTLRNSKVACLITGVVSLVMTIPIYLLYETKGYSYLPSGVNGSYETIWVLADSSIVVDEPSYKDFYLVFYGIVVKMTSCILLLVLSTLMLITLRKTIYTRQSPRRNSSENKRKDMRQRQHTTVMLIAVLMAFVVTEFPKAIVSLMGGIDRKLYHTVTQPLDAFLRMLTLCNNSLKFILYCSMSYKFRATFSELFLKKLNCIQGTQSDKTDPMSSSFRTRKTSIEETRL